MSHQCSANNLDIPSSVMSDSFQVLGGSFLNKMLDQVQVRKNFEISHLFFLFSRYFISHIKNSQELNNFIFFQDHLNIPYCGLCLGLLLTALCQSSSTSTAIFITLVAADLFTVSQV